MAGEWNSTWIINAWEKLKGDEPVRYKLKAVTNVNVGDLVFKELQSFVKKKLNFQRRRSRITKIPTCQSKMPNIPHEWFQLYCTYLSKRGMQIIVIL